MESAPTIELDPDIDMSAEDWATYVDKEPFALAHQRPPRAAEGWATGRTAIFFEAIDDLFATMHALPHCETTAEAASFCLTAVLRALPSRIGLVQIYDPEVQQFVVVYAQGEGSEDLLMMRTEEADPLITQAMTQGAPRSFHYEEGGTTEERPANRHAFFGPVRSVLVAPVSDKGRYLGVIELLDPADGSYFDARAENTLSYVAGRFGEFLVRKGATIGNIVGPSALARSAMDAAMS
ncbi:hypothetical protein LZC95_14800 [Pendulispora brunnea]|uniref:GAF domain-containing protein n=1 Tax=Pendulispora brunnea TaxID=2905690 RepID=A0ABZ2KHE6_9BACT